MKKDIVLKAFDLVSKKQEINLQLKNMLPELAKELYKRGYSYDRIVALLGVSKGTLAKVMKESNIKIRRGRPKIKR